MDYNEIKTKCFAVGQAHDGYNGHTARVRFALVGRKIVTVWKGGCFNAGLPDVLTKDEGIWILNHHPSARQYFAVHEWPELFSSRGK